MGHFIYTRTVQKRLPDPKDEKATITETISFKESFNLNKVIRSVMRDTETLIVLLDDGHEESISLPGYSDKGRKVPAQNKRMFLASEIELKDEDIQRFFDAISS